MKRLILTLLCATLIALPATAQQGNGYPVQSWSPGQARDAVKKGQNKSLGDIYAGLRSRYGGKALDARLIDGNTYSIVWESGNGRVLNLIVDARTGQVKSEKGAR